VTLFVMKYFNSNKHKTVNFLKRGLIASIVFCTTIITISIFSETAHASLFSFISNIFDSSTASANIKNESRFSINSQTMAILQPAVNIDPNPNKASGIAPVEHNTLVSDLAMGSFDDASDVVNTQISQYTVRTGDTLSEIAQMFNVSVNTIMWANEISKAKGIQPGQSLIILPVTGITYTIKKGDTIKGIVSSYKADLNEVLDYNGMSVNTKLVAGQTIIIPDAEIQTSVATKIVYGTNTAHDTNGPSYAGYYIRPIDGGRKSQGLHGYNGVDLAAPIGTPIYASAAGKVIASMSGGYNGGYGNYIIISHGNGTQTLYSHNSKNVVSVGQYVEQGQKIGEIGSTGKSTGPHVHFEIRGAKNPF
jgi:murein DD-endopeptidase MepM/ murein hydrolase activator NlpD